MLEGNKKKIKKNHALTVPWTRSTAMTPLEVEAAIAFTRCPLASK